MNPLEAYLLVCNYLTQWELAGFPAPASSPKASGPGSGAELGAGSSSSSSPGTFKLGGATLAAGRLAGKTPKAAIAAGKEFAAHMVTIDRPGGAGVAVVGPGALSGFGVMTSGETPGWLGLILDAGYRALSAQLMWMLHAYRPTPWADRFWVTEVSNIPGKANSTKYCGQKGNWVERFIPWPMPLQGKIDIPTKLPMYIKAGGMPATWNIDNRDPNAAWRVPYGRRVNDSIFRKWTAHTSASPADQAEYAGQYMPLKKRIFSEFAKQWSLDVYPWDDAWYNHTGACLIENGPHLKTKWVDGRGEIDYWAIDMTTKEGADARQFVERMMDYRFHCEWLVTAGEWLRLCQKTPFYSVEWARHCTSWGVGCASPYRIANAKKNGLLSPIDNWPDDKPLVTMPRVKDIGAVLQALMKHTPPPGSIIDEERTKFWSRDHQPSMELDKDWNNSPCIDWPDVCGSFKPRAMIPQWWVNQLIDEVGDWTAERDRKWAQKEAQFWKIYNSCISAVASLGAGAASSGMEFAQIALEVGTEIAGALVEAGVLPGAFLPALSIATSLTSGEFGMTANPAAWLDQIAQVAKDNAERGAHWVDYASEQIQGLQDNINAIKNQGWEFIGDAMGSYSTILDKELKDNLSASYEV